MHLTCSHILYTLLHATPHTCSHTRTHTHLHTHCRALDKLKRQIKAAKDEKKRVRELIAQGIDPATVPAPNQTIGEQCYHLHLAPPQLCDSVSRGVWGNDVCVVVSEADVRSYRVARL